MRRRWGLPLWLAMVVILGLLAPRLASCLEEEIQKSEDFSGGHPVEEAEDDDMWEDLEDEDESSSVGSKKTAQSPILQLNDQTAEKLLKSNEYVMVLGYASWCRQSAAVMVDYAEAASVLAEKGSSVVLTKVDAIVNQGTAGKYKIKGFPTILFFRNGSDEIYPAGFTSEEIVNWVLKQTGFPATTVVSSLEVEKIQGQKKTLAIGFFEKLEGEDYEEFIAASVAVSDVEFLQTTVAEAAQAFGVEMVGSAPTVGLWKSFEPLEKISGPFKKGEVAAFVNLNKYPMVTQLHTQNVAKVYSSPVKKQVILFSSSGDYDKLQTFYKTVAKTFEDRLMFLWVDVADEEFAKPMLTMYGIPDDEPTVAGFDNDNGMRFLLDAKVTEEAVTDFATKYLGGKLTMHYKSEKTPKDNTGEVKVVVGKTFGSLVLESPTDVVLLVHTPYCFDCESMGKVFLKVAKHYRGNSSSLIFGKIDGAANEHPELKVANYPAILFYPANSVSKDPILGPSKPNFKRLVKFVDEQLQLRSAVRNAPSNEAEKSEVVMDVLAEKNSVLELADGEISKVTDIKSGSTGSVPEGLVALEVPLPTEVQSCNIPVAEVEESHTRPTPPQCKANVAEPEVKPSSGSRCPHAAGSKKVKVTKETPPSDSECELTTGTNKYCQSKPRWVVEERVEDLESAAVEDSSVETQQPIAVDEDRIVESLDNCKRLPSMSCRYLDV